MRFKAGKRKCYLKATWFDVLLSDAIALVEMDVEPERLESVIRKGRYDADLYADFMFILSTCPKADFLKMDRYMQEVLFDQIRYVLEGIFFIDTIAESYEPQGLSRVKHNGIWYQTPKPFEFEDQKLIAVNEPAKNMTEASDLMKTLAEMKSGGLNNMPYVCALWLKRIEGEEYDDEKVVQRAKEFRTLPMWAVWEVFFYTCYSLTSLASGLACSVQRRGKLVRVRDLLLGYILLLKRGSRGICRKLKRWAFGVYVRFWITVRGKLNK